LLRRQRAIAGPQKRIEESSSIEQAARRQNVLIREDDYEEEESKDLDYPHIALSEEDIGTGKRNK
jgi:hypothetical protein